jgi:hypothetical protein
LPQFRECTSVSHRMTENQNHHQQTRKKYC